MAERFFQGLEAFERFLVRQAAIDLQVVDGAASVASHILYEHVVGVFGDATKLEDLAPSTQEERARLGYTANDPLLRTGEKLRDTVERLHEHLIAGVGSPDPVQAYHEFGYVSRGGTPVPARPVYEIAIVESEEKIELLLEAAVDAILGGKGEVAVLEGITTLVP
jgi:hypothetical protein